MDAPSASSDVELGQLKVLAHDLVERARLVEVDGLPSEEDEDVR